MNKFDKVRSHIKTYNSILNKNNDCVYYNYVSNEMKRINETLKYYKRNEEYYNKLWEEQKLEMEKSRVYSELDLFGEEIWN